MLAVGETEYGVCGNSAPSSQFFYNSKTVLKNKVYLENIILKKEVGGLFKIRNWRDTLNNIVCEPWWGQLWKSFWGHMGKFEYNIGWFTIFFRVRVVLWLNGRCPHPYRNRTLTYLGMSWCCEVWLWSPHLTINYSGGDKSTFGDNKSKSGKMLGMVTKWKMYWHSSQYSFMISVSLKFFKVKF